MCSLFASVHQRVESVVAANICPAQLVATPIKSISCLHSCKIHLWLWYMGCLYNRVCPFPPRPCCAYAVLHALLPVLPEIKLRMDQTTCNKAEPPPGCSVMRYAHTPPYPHTFSHTKLTPLPPCCHCFVVAAVDSEASQFRA